MLDHRGFWIGPDEWFLEEDREKQAASGAEEGARTGAVQPDPAAS